MVKKKISGEILILDPKKKFYLDDDEHKVYNLSLEGDEIDAAIMKGAYNLVIIPDDDRAEEKLKEVPEPCRRLRLLIVSLFNLLPSKEKIYRDMGITRFARIDEVSKFVKDFLLLEEKEKKKAEKEKREA